VLKWLDYTIPLWHNSHMNRLPLADRTRILAALCEGNSVRGTSRMTGAAKGTILRLLADVGDACSHYMDETMRDLRCERLQLDEIWSFCGAKEKNVPFERRGEDGIGDMWTWIAIDADTKLVPTFLLGKRDSYSCNEFVRDLANRLGSQRVQITTDGFGAYKPAISREFFGRVDFAQCVKEFGLDPNEPEKRYSPSVVTSITTTVIVGDPDLKHTNTSYVERQNLTLRMGQRRFTRLTNGFSKKAENLARSLALHYMHYNFCRKHMTIKTTPAMAAGLTDRLWTLHDLARLPDMIRDREAA
jgi:IS1 family transposase